jgi:hypothetical protein
MNNWRARFKASGIHLGLSLAVAALAAMLVFWVWYPYPYREISGGRELFLLIVTVDVILGPLITFFIFSKGKSLRALRFDFVVIGLLQLAALAYGLWTVAQARPVHLGFEFERFRVVHAIEVDPEKLPLAPPELQSLPWTGPTLLAVRPFRTPEEQYTTTMAALSGFTLAANPALWQTYDKARADVIKAAKPVNELKQRFGSQAAQIDAVLQSAGRDPATTSYLPMVGRKSFWTVFIDPKTAEVVGFLPLDSF